MAKTSTMQMELGAKAPEFELPDTDGTVVKSINAAGERGLIVAFICNHCPYVKHVRHEFADLAREYMDRGIGVVAINSNDVAQHPDDSPEMMAKEKIEIGYGFPYLFDESQAVAKAYGAACTPDFYLFDGDLALVYRGRMDETRPDGGLVATGSDLRAACGALLAGDAPLAEQLPSMGCGIKWKTGGIPVYAS